MKQPDLMAKLKAFEAAHPQQRGPKCSGCTLPASAREFITTARKSQATFRSIAAVLTAEGFKMSAYTLGRHLREHAQG